LQPENAVPIKSWFDDQSDTELYGLCEFLKNLNNFSDVRTVLGVIAKDPIASKQQTTSAKVLNSILSETKNRVRNTTPDRRETQQSFNSNSNTSQNQSN
jgi:hypothetical protein